MAGRNGVDTLAALPHHRRLRERAQGETHLRELAAANLKLAEMNRMKTEFVAEISHELRTALHSLSLYVQLLEKGQSDKQEHYRAMLQGSVEYLIGFVEDTLNLSQLELSHGHDDLLDATDLNSVVRQALALQQPRAECGGLVLVSDLAEELPLIAGDYRLLHQLVTNLVVNAIKYTPAGAVRVHTYYNPSTRQVGLEVSDTGMGITTEDLPHIFKRFYRGRAERRKDISGNGLGLALVNEIVELHRARIFVWSEPDVGSCFTVEFPL